MNRFLVFTSAGDSNNLINLWLGDERGYDLCICYYGDSDELFKEYERSADRVFRRKGSKFQNLYYLFGEHPEYLLSYDYVFVLDDDIIFGVCDINRMFNNAVKYQLAICGPSFSREGKISHTITVSNKYLQLAYTNFVEVNALLFHRDALLKLMEVYSESLIGWGIDFLAIWANGIHEDSKYAICHDVVCINPHDREKSMVRELSKIPNMNNRRRTWEEYALTIGCPPEWRHKVYRVKRKPLLKRIAYKLQHLAERTRNWSKRINKKFIQLLLK